MAASASSDLPRAEDLQSQLYLSRNQSHLPPRAFAAHTDIGRNQAHWQNQVRVEVNIAGSLISAWFKIRLRSDQISLVPSTVVTSDC